MEMLRRVYGIAEPTRRQMELKMVRDANTKPAVLGGGRTASVHEDVLGGRDTEVSWEDVFLGMLFLHSFCFCDSPCSY